MNQERRCMKQADSTRRSSLQSSDFPAEPWHSTPVKKHQDARLDSVASERNRMVKQENGQHQGRLPLSTSLPLTQDDQMTVHDLENSTLQRQRRELQLLMAELKDRDKELNNMAAAHHTQLLAWQQDRQRVLLLEERCARLEEELQQQHGLLRAVGRRAQSAESQEQSSQRELSTTQKQLHDLRHTQRHSSQLQQELEDRNQALNSTITLLSSQVGQLQAREEELSAMLKLKDKDVTEAITHIQELSCRLSGQEDAQRELRVRESKALAELEEIKRRYRELRHENTKLKDELQEKTLENSTQREEVIRLKQETQLLKRDLLISGEGESWKDEMLELSRSKQERTETELRCLRQVCTNQQNDLQLLKLNLESAQEALKQQEVQRSRDSDLGYTAVEGIFERTGTEAEAGYTFYQRRAIEPPEELRKERIAPVEWGRQEISHQPTGSPESSRVLLNSNSMELSEAEVSPCGPGGGFSPTDPLGNLSAKPLKPGSVRTQSVANAALDQPTAAISVNQPKPTLSTPLPTVSSTSQSIATTTSQPVVAISTANAADTTSTGPSVLTALTGQLIATSSPSQPVPSVAPEQHFSISPTDQPLTMTSTSPTAPPVAMVSTAPPVAMVSTAPPVAMVSTAPPVAMVSTAPPVAMVSTAPPVAMVSTAPPVAMVSTAPSVAMISTAPPVDQPTDQSIIAITTSQSAPNTDQPLTTISTHQPVTRDSICHTKVSVPASQSMADLSTAPPVVSSSISQTVGTSSALLSVTPVSIAQPVATTSTSHLMATVPICQAGTSTSTHQPEGTISTGQPTGEPSSRGVSSSPCPPDVQLSSCTTPVHLPAIAHEQTSASRHSERNSVKSVGQDEGSSTRDTPGEEAGERQMDEPGLGGGVETDRCECERGPAEKEVVVLVVEKEEEEENLEVEVAVMLEGDCESQYSVQMVEVDPETDQVCRACQGEVTCSPEPSSPILWASAHPVGSPRAIYLTSPASPQYGFQEVDCSSTQRLQRLLDESRQMVATLEGLSLESTIPSPRSVHSHSPGPSYKPSHSPAPNNASAGTLNGCYDYSSSPHSGSEVHSLNSSGHSSKLIRKVHHLTKNSSSKPGEDTSQ